ncbi:hypothetical protein BJ741DRAFT_613773 [Chytriomyces cf. hyalinus JEL632]|nr:hypothetical protein BJ741DRAFT_613773 [Chytriomyces cf. hyalinus JEL632]
MGDQASDEDNDGDDRTEERVQRKSDTSSKARAESNGGDEGENYRVQLEKKIALARQFLDSFANDRHAEVEALSKSSEVFVRTQKKSISKLRQTQDETFTTVTTRVREFQKTAESKRVRFLDMYAQIEDQMSGYKIQSENAIQEMQAHTASVYKESQSLIKKDLGSGSKIKNAMEALLCV